MLNMFERKMVEFVPEFYLKSLKNLYNEIVFDYLHKKQLVPYS